jgi:peptidyl-Lys metalloendopeptidase
MKTLIFRLFFTLFCSIYCATANASLPIGVSISIQTQKTSVEKSSDIQLTVSYRNDTDTQLRMLAWDTALESPIVSDLFNVYVDGEVTEYTGPIVKRREPLPSDYILLEPGQSLSSQIDLTNVYNMQLAGKYTVSLKSHLNSKTSTTNSVTITVRSETQILKQPPNFASCSSSQQTSLDNALSGAESLANRAFSSIVNTSLSARSQAALYRQWFGAYEESRWNRVKDNFSRIASATSNQTVNFSCDCPDVSSDDVIAYVFPSSPYSVYICPGFFNFRSIGGANSQSGIIIHELSHFSVLADTDDHVYGVGGALALAVNTPSQAISNADNYEYFAENPFGLNMTSVASGGDSGGGTIDPNPTSPRQDPERSASFLSVILPFLINKSENRDVSNPSPSPGSIFAYPTLPARIPNGVDLAVVAVGNENDKKVGQTPIIWQLNSLNNPARMVYASTNYDGITIAMQKTDKPVITLNAGLSGEAVGELTRRIYSPAITYTSVFHFGSLLPLLSFSTGGGATFCSDNAPGSFEILSISYQPQTGSVSSHINSIEGKFEVSCNDNGGKVRGRFRYNDS